jgi:hypothetical protein
MQQCGCRFGIWFLELGFVWRLQFSDLIVPLLEIAWKRPRRKSLGALRDDETAESGVKKWLVAVLPFFSFR